MLTEATRTFDPDSLAVQLADARATVTATERDVSRLEGELEVAKKSVGTQAVCLEGNYLPAKQGTACEAALKVAEENVTRLVLEALRRDDQLRNESAKAESLRNELVVAKAALGEAEAGAEQLTSRTSFQEDMLAKRAEEVGQLTREVASLKAALQAAEETVNRTIAEAAAAPPSPPDENASALLAAAAQREEEERAERERGEEAARAEAAEAMRLAKEAAEGSRREAAQLEERLAAKTLEATRLEQRLAASAAEIDGLTKRLAAAKAIRAAQENSSDAEDILNSHVPNKIIGPEGCKHLASELADARAALRVAEGPALTAAEAACGCDCEALGRELSDARAAIEVAEALPPSAQQLQSATDWELAVRGFLTSARTIYLEVRSGQYGDPNTVLAAAGTCALALLALLCCCCGGLLYDSSGF